MNASFSIKMDTLIFSLLEFLIISKAQYLQIFLEEYGQYYENSTSLYKVLIRSYDPGIELNEVQKFSSQLDSVYGNKFQFISFLMQENCILRYQDSVFSKENISECIGLGTSLSFEFTNSIYFPIELHQFLENNIQDLCFLEYTPTSKFIDLSQYNINNVKPPPIDFTDSIVQSLSFIVSKSEILNLYIKTNYNMNTNALIETLKEIMKNN